MSLFWFAAAAIILGYLLTQTKAGNWIQAAGGNADAARARGVDVSRTKICLFMLSSAMAAFAGIISSIRTSAANPNSGTGYELEVIAMVVIGGTAPDRRARHDHRDGAGHLHPARDAQRHRAHWRAGPRLQHLHRHDYPRDDGASFMARSQAPGRNVRQWPMS